MKSIKRWTIFAVMAAVVTSVLTACSIGLPPNIPLTGNTPQAGTPQPVQGYPGVPTNTPALVTATAPVATTAPGGAPTATFTSAPPTAAPPTAAPPTATPTVTNTPNTGGSNGGTSGGNTSGGQGSIALPAQRTTIQFPANTSSYVVNTNLGSGTTQAYQLQVSSGQRMFISIDGNAVMQLYDPNQNKLSGILSAINPVQISVSQNGNHYIVLQGSGPISMSVYVPPQGANQNIAAPVPANLTDIQFQSGTTSTSFNVNATQGTPVGYRLNVQAGQTMTVTTNGNATFTLLAPDGKTMVPSRNAPTHQWVFPLAQSGNYTLVMLGNGAVSVKISIPATSGSVNTPRPQPSFTVTPIPLPGSSTRVSFGAGNASATINTTLTAGTPKAYVLTVLAGQTLYVQTNGTVDVTAYGPNQAVLLTGRANYPNRWTIPVTTTGDYTFVVSGSGANQMVFYVPPK